MLIVYIFPGVVTKRNPFDLAQSFGSRFKPYLVTMKARYTERDACNKYKCNDSDISAQYFVHSVNSNQQVAKALVVCK